MVVGVMKVTTVVMSKLVSVLRPLSSQPFGLLISTGIFVGVGLTMFLLPPVPGAAADAAARMLNVRGSES